MTLLLALLLWAASPVWANPTLSPRPTGLPASAKPEVLEAAKRPGWEDRNNVANEWVSLSGPGGRKFLVRHDELERFQKDPKQPPALYELVKLSESYAPNAHAFYNHGALWQGTMDLKESEYRLSGQPQGKSVALAAVKGTEVVPLKNEGRRGAFTMTRVRVERKPAPVPADKPAAPPPAKAAAGPAKTAAPTTAAPPPPPAKKAAAPQAPETKGAAARRPPSDPESALKLLFPDHEAARIVARAILEDDERKAPGSTRAFLEAMGAMQADPNKLAAAREAWGGRIATACAIPASGPLKGSKAFGQAREIWSETAGWDGGSGIHEPVPMSEPAAAATAMQSLCAAAKAPPATKKTLPDPKKGLTPADPKKGLRTQAPPPPPAATPERKKAEGGAAAAAAQTKGGSNSDKMTKYAAIGAAAGAILGSFFGPLGALIGAVIGALIGAGVSYLAGKLTGGGGAPREETQQAP